MPVACRQSRAKTKVAVVCFVGSRFFHVERTIIEFFIVNKVQERMFNMGINPKTISSASSVICAIPSIFYFFAKTSAPYPPFIATSIAAQIFSEASVKSASVCAAEMKPTSYPLGPKYTPLCNNSWCSTLNFSMLAGSI